MALGIAESPTPGNGLEAVNQTATMPPSVQPSRIDLGSVAVRTFTPVVFSQRLRTAASIHESKSSVTGTLNVRDLLASYLPSRR